MRFFSFKLHNQRHMMEKRKKTIKLKTWSTARPYKVQRELVTRRIPLGKSKIKFTFCCIQVNNNAGKLYFALVVTPGSRTKRSSTAKLELYRSPPILAAGCSSHLKSWKRDRKGKIFIKCKRLCAVKQVRFLTRNARSFRVSSARVKEDPSSHLHVDVDDDDMASN